MYSPGVENVNENDLVGVHHLRLELPVVGRDGVRNVVVDWSRSRWCRPSPSAAAGSKTKLSIVTWRTAVAALRQPTAANDAGQRRAPSRRPSALIRIGQPCNGVSMTARR